MGFSRSILGLVLSALLAGSGCTLSNMTPQARFQDAAYTLNDAARWSNVDLASRYVSPTYMEAFIARRREWGQRISIADADLTRLRLGEDRDFAMSEVSLNWYDTHGVTTRSSVIQQQWESRRGGYVLVSETVTSGDPSIFAELPAEDASAGGVSPQ